MGEMTVPNSLYEAIGGLVSECADSRDVYPDAATALEAIASTVNEIYGCIESGVFGPIARTPDAELVEALREIAEAMEYAAGCDEGVGEDAAAREVMSWAGSPMAVAYTRARSLVSLYGEGGKP